MQAFLSIKRLSFLASCTKPKEILNLQVCKAIIQIAKLQIVKMHNPNLKVSFSAPLSLPHWAIMHFFISDYAKQQSAHGGLLFL